MLTSSRKVDECKPLVPGLGAVPLSDRGRPVLFVGNHQTLSPDLPFLIEQFITERGVLLRGLAHPAVMAAVTGGGGGGGGGGLGAAVGGAVGATVGVGSGRNCSPHHRMPFAFASRNESLNAGRQCSGHWALKQLARRVRGCVR